MSEEDWAKRDAREWLKKQRLTVKYYEASLADLLRSTWQDGSNDEWDSWHDALTKDSK